MNYYLEKHDMNIVLDALELLHDNMKNREKFGLSNNEYTIEDVHGLLVGTNWYYESKWGIRTTAKEELREHNK